MKKSTIYVLIGVAVFALLYFFLKPDESASASEIYASAKQSNFVVSVGVQTDIEKELTKLEQIKIDTAIQMKGVRDDIANMQFSMAQERLEIERNKYEPQMVIDQSKLKLQNSERSMDQLKGKTELMVIQSDAKVREIQANLKQLDAKLKQMTDLASSFTITAPEDGMLIYERSWNGKKGPGSQISAWDPTVAELPDLTKMTSVAYINEIDISKIKKGQIVKIKVDAFPEKDFDGQIISVANIGQELKGQEAKVFEIVIAVNQIDDILRPAMTTTNEIKIYEYPASSADKAQETLDLWQKAKTALDSENAEKVEGQKDQNKDMDSGNSVIIFQ